MVIGRLLVAALVLGGCVKAPTQAPAELPAPAAPTANAPANATATISGIVTHKKTKQGLDRALVVLQGSALPQSRETQTNANGLYAFRDLPPGTYTVQVLIGAADIVKVTDLPMAARFRANFSLDPDSDGIVCRLPIARIPEPTESLLSIDETEARLLGVPPTRIHR